MRLNEMKNISIAVAAKLMGKTPQYVKVGLQQQRLPIGTAVKMSSKWTFIFLIYKESASQVI